MTQLIDSHCHLDFDYENKSSDDLISEAQAAGVNSLITIGTDIKSLDKIIPIAEKYSNIFYTAGIHPHDTIDAEANFIEKIKTASQHSKCVAIGEIGLDFHYDHSPHDVQIKLLKQQLQLALEVKLPVVIHSREAEKELLKELTQYADPIKEDRSPGVIHCFTGTKEFAKACIQLGFYISFSGILTFKKSDELRDIAKDLPLDKILVETDSPYLAPVPYRGKKCEPKMVFETAKVLAQTKDISLDELAQATTANTVHLFNLPK